MKIKGLRWLVLTLVVLITIINYLDRGTLTYMWAPDTKFNYVLVNEPNKTNLPNAVYSADKTTITLFDKDGTEKTVASSEISLKEIEGKQNAVYAQKDKGGIAISLGLIDPNQPKKVVDDQLKKLYSYIYIFFMIAYGISQLLSGKLYDKIGTRVGFVTSAFIWGTADMLTSLASGLSSLSFFRVMLGLGEAGPWPGAVKSNAEWFPIKERAFAQGLFGAGGSIGNILAPIVISMLYISFGWKNTFLIVGSLGIIWTIPWLIINKKSPSEHTWITEEERDYILAGQTNSSQNANDRGKTWGELLRSKKSYSLILGRFFLDPVWWMFVAWLPNYLSSKFKLDIKQVAFSAWVPYVGAAIGAIAGGWFSGMLMRKGKSAAYSRKIAIAIGACITLPAMIAAAYANSTIAAVSLMALILGGFQFSIVNVQTLPSDYYSGKTVGSLAGLGGLAAVFGTVITMFLVPYITTGNNWGMFFGMGALLVPLSIGSIFYFSKEDTLATT